MTSVRPFSPRFIIIVVMLVANNEEWNEQGGRDEPGWGRCLLFEVGWTE